LLCQTLGMILVSSFFFNFSVWTMEFHHQISLILKMIIVIVLLNLPFEFKGRQLLVYFVSIISIGRILTNEFQNPMFSPTIFSHHS
jgi:hypothetical protein